MPSRSQELVLIILVVSAIIMLLIAFIFFILVSYYRRQKKLLDHQKHLEKQFSETLLQSRLEIQEQTLKQIGHELHDNLGQAASLIKMLLYTIDLSKSEKAEQRIQEAKLVISQLITDVKSLSVSLGSDRLNREGLASALKTEIDRINKSEQFIAVYEQNGEIRALNDEKSLILFRMVQEMLNNAIKHSDASEIKMTVNVTDRSLVIQVADNGDGFNVEEGKEKGGAGLANLQQRATLLNAQLRIHSVMGRGTEVQVEIGI